MSAAGGVDINAKIAAHRARVAAHNADIAARKAVREAKPSAQDPDYIVALRLALPIVQRAASASPTTPGRIQRAREASNAAIAIRAALSRAAVEGGA